MIDEPGYYETEGDRLVHTPQERREDRLDRYAVIALALCVFVLPAAIGQTIHWVLFRHPAFPQPATSLRDVARAVADSSCTDVAVYIVSQPAPPGQTIEQAVAEQVHADASASVTRGQDTIVVVGWDCA